MGPRQHNPLSPHPTSGWAELEGPHPVCDMSDFWGAPVTPPTRADRGWHLPGSLRGDFLEAGFFPMYDTCVWLWLLSQRILVVRLCTHRMTDLETCKAGRDFEGHLIQFPCCPVKEIGTKRRKGLVGPESEVFSLLFCLFIHLYMVSVLFCDPNRLQSSPRKLWL